MTDKDIDTKIASLEAQIAKLRRKKEMGNMLTSVKPGDRVMYDFGRADSRRVLEGVIQAIGDVGPPMGTVAVIQHGLGLDIQIHKVRLHDIVRNITAEGRNGSQVKANDVDPLTVS